MADPSAATFIIVILVLVGLGLAFAMNVYFTRRQSRMHLENVLRAGLSISSQSAAEPPNLWEIWIRRTIDEEHWGSLKPICATQIPDSTVTPISESRQKSRKSLNPFTTSTSISTAGTPPKQEPVKNSAAQVAVLISMPSFPHNPPYVSTSTKENPSNDNGDDGVFPDVMFGISTLVCQGDHGSRL